MRVRLLPEELLSQSGVATRLVRIQDRQYESQGKENSSQPGSELDQDVRRLRAENIFGHAAAKCRAKSLALGTLHQDHQDHQQGDQNVDRQ